MKPLERPSKRRKSFHGGAPIELSTPPRVEGEKGDRVGLGGRIESGAPLTIAVLLNQEELFAKERGRRRLKEAEEEREKRRNEKEKATRQEKLGNLKIGQREKKEKSKEKQKKTREKEAAARMVGRTTLTQLAKRKRTSPVKVVPMDDEEEDVEREIGRTSAARGKELRRGDLKADPKKGHQLGEHAKNGEEQDEDEFQRPSKRGRRDLSLRMSSTPPAEAKKFTLSLHYSEDEGDEVEPLRGNQGRRGGPKVGDGGGSGRKVDELAEDQILFPSLSDHGRPLLSSAPSFMLSRPPRTVLPLILDPDEIDFDPT